MKFCTKCGKELLDEAVICVGCGCAVERPAAAPAAVPAGNLLTQLSSRVQVDAIVWLVIGILQIILGFTVDWFILLVGVLNIVLAVQDYTYSKAVLTNPTGIVKKYEPLVGPIITLVYNLFIGGIVGVVGSVYYFVGVRGFVLKNRAAFDAMDEPTV